MHIYLYFEQENKEHTDRGMISQSPITANAKKYDKPLFLAVLAALSLFMVCWYAPVSDYGGHDYFFNLQRFRTLMDALQSGNYPVYLDYQVMEGYGYFTKAFYPDLMLLPFAALAILTGIPFAYDTMIFTYTFLCGLFMYQAVHTVFKNEKMAYLSAILYTFSAYHLFDWYNRGALGEAISFTFLPIVFLGLYEIAKGYYRRWYVLTIGYSLLVYTHLLSSFLTFITLVIVLLFHIRHLIKEPKRILFLLLAAGVTIPIVASYIFPMLEQMASNTFNYSSAVNITGQTKLSLQQIGLGMLSGLFYPEGENIAGTGILLIVLIVMRLFVKEKSPGLKMADCCALIGVIYIIVMSFIFPWGRLPLGFIQFPWRLYEFVVFFFSIAGAYYLISIIKTRKQYIAASVGVLVLTLATIVVGNNNYVRWQTKALKDIPELFTGIPSVDNEYYLGGREYMPAKVPTYRMFNERKDSITSSRSGIYTANMERKNGITSFDVTTSEPVTLELPLIYYKGYKAFVGENEVLLEESARGLIQISTDKSGKAEVFYRGTIIQKVSWYVSLISTILLCLFIFRYRKREQQ